MHNTRTRNQNTYLSPTQHLVVSDEKEMSKKTVRRFGFKGQMSDLILEEDFFGNNTQNLLQQNFTTPLVYKCVCVMPREWQHGFMNPTEIHTEHTLQDHNESLCNLSSKKTQLRLPFDIYITKQPFSKAPCSFRHSN